MPVLSVSDINGRFKKVEAFLTHKIELKTVHKPYWGKGPRICGLTADHKLDMFVQNGSEPLTFLTAGFNAAVAQASDDDLAFSASTEGKDGETRTEPNIRCLMVKLHNKSRNKYA